MRIALVVVIAGLAASSPAEADFAFDLKAIDPVARLPLVAADATYFVRAYKRYRAGCKRPDVFVEDGSIEAAVTEPAYSQTQLLGGCGEARDAFAGNLGSLNVTLRGLPFGSPAKRGWVFRRLPATFEADGMRIDVTAGTRTAHVTINRLDRRVEKAWIGARRMDLDVTPFDVRAWYVVDQKSRRQLAVLVSGRTRDGAIQERWVEVWADRAPAKLEPIDVARRWVHALAAGDAAALAATTGLPFERIGFEPGGDRGKACASKRKATKPDELEGVLACALAEAPRRYAELYDDREVAKLPAKYPAPLAPHARILAAMAGRGLAMFVFSTSDDKGAATVALAVHKGKVVAVVEAR